MSVFGAHLRQVKMQSEANDAALFASVVIPCRNERRYIKACLDSILTSGNQSRLLEVLVIDGHSDDGTREIVADYSLREPRVQLVDNPKRITPVALNVGARMARGDTIIIMGAHCRYPADYVAGLVSWLERTNADVVGGICRTIPATDQPIHRAIAAAMSHPFGVGNSHFRVGVSSPRWVDTVPFGCYRREVFHRIGYFDEDLVRNQDDEFNYRLLTRGGRLLLVPEIVSEYIARDSFGKLARMFYQYGVFKPTAARKVGRILSVRQLVPPAFVAALGGSLVLAPLSEWMAALCALIVASYSAIVLATAAIAAPRLGLRGAGCLAVAFPILHMSYGFGFLRGTVNELLAGRLTRQDPAAIPVSR